MISKCVDVLLHHIMSDVRIGYYWLLILLNESHGAETFCATWSSENNRINYVNFFKYIRQIQILL